jgi:anti-sigma factor RsiW
MTRTQQRDERAHRRVGELLPWYVNGTLSPDERQAVEGHLEVCTRCREEERACRAESAALREAGEVAPSAHPARFARLMARIDQGAPARAPFWDRFGDRFRSGPGAGGSPVRWALAAQLAVILVLAGLLLRDRGPRGLREGAPVEPAAVYRTLSEPAVPAPALAPGTAPARLRVLFAEDATERQIRQILLEVHGQIAAGPSSFGAYTVEVPAGDEPPEIVLAHLRSRPEVRFAERIDGEGGRP